jgi:phage regulator Rha-like protein
VNIGIVADEAAILNFISSNLNIVDHSGELNSINSDPQYLRNGKIYNIKNGLNVPLVIKHLGSSGDIKFSFPNEVDFILQENEVVQFLYNQSSNQNPRLDFIGRISVGSNIDQTVAENSTNAVSGGGVFDFVQPILEKTVPIITDSFTILDSVDSKRKKLTFDNLINYVKVFFDQSLALFKTANFLDLTSSAQTQIDSKQVKDSQIEVNGSTNVSNAWNGKTILVTASCTITIPATLLDQFMFVGRTLAGVTLTIAITTPFTFETVPTTITEKKTFSLIRRGSTNTILLDS